MNAIAHIVTHIDDLPVGSLRMVRVGNRKVCLIRTSSGVHALDSACPHEGYGLTQGSLDGTTLTCAWHNWKFDVTTGSCTLGEEDVRTHTVSIDAAGNVDVTLVEPSPIEVRRVLLTSLRSGIERNYIGQIARDVVRLLRNDTNPGELIWEAVAYGVPRAEFGWGHAVASATDCLSMVDDYDGDHRTLPIVQAIAGVAEEERGRAVRHLPDPASDTSQVSRHAFLAMVEAERVADAQAAVRAAIHSGRSASELRSWFTAAVSAHHLSYGHGAIYAQKAFELLDMLGWDRADTVLPHLVPTIVQGTREDTLPYARPFARALSGIDLPALANVTPTVGWHDDGSILSALLDSSDRTLALQTAHEALRQGAGVDAILDVVVDAVSHRMLRYDVAGEYDFTDDFGWLDITHGLTYANAARWHHEHEGSTPDTIRLALFTLFLAHWTGRHEWHAGIGQQSPVTLISDDLAAAARHLRHESLLDRTSSFIVHAHGVKTSVAASREALRRSTPLPLLATTRFLQTPRLERFVAANVQRSIEFVAGHQPRDE